VNCTVQTVHAHNTDLISSSHLLQPTENELQEHFAKYDTNNSNAIERGELLHVLRFVVLVHDVFMHLQHSHTHIKDV
jgi:Ca2+-binding EF-hand superfamily protein